MEGLGTNCHPRIRTLKVLVVDDNHSMRKLLRTMLAAIGVPTIYEASSGLAGLKLIQENKPDLVIVDWEMPGVDGSQLVRTVRSPDEFPEPDVPIIVLTGHGDRWRVVEAARLGAHEFLLKPVSINALQSRILDIICNPRPTVKLNNYYGPMPRRIAAI